jgi:hypothetical protein
MMMRCTVCNETFSSLYRAKPMECPKCTGPAVYHGPAHDCPDRRAPAKAPRCDAEVLTAPKDQR